MMTTKRNPINDRLLTDNAFLQWATGTGKTVTVTECALQLLHNNASSRRHNGRLLLCAPTNFSADMICRLVGNPPICRLVGNPLTCRLVGRQYSDISVSSLCIMHQNTSCSCYPRINQSDMLVCPVLFQ